MLNNLINRIQSLSWSSSRSVRRRKTVFHSSAETMEVRQVLAASMIGAVSPSGNWQIDLSRSGGSDADRQFGLANDQFVVGNWNQTGDQPGVARKDGLYLRWYLNTDADVSPTHESSFL